MEIKRIAIECDDNWLKSDELLNLHNEAMNSVIDGLCNNFDNIIIEGLKLKGFEFEHKAELEQFIKTRCSCIDNLPHQQKVFSVDNIPFLLHDYEVVIEPITTDKKGIKMSANMGSYCFL